MSRRPRLYTGIVLILSVIVLLQLVNHFMMFQERRVVDSVCECNSNTINDETIVVSAEQFVGQNTKTGPPQEKTFQYYLEGLLSTIDHAELAELRRYGVEDAKKLKNILLQISSAGQKKPSANSPHGVEAQVAEVQEICPEKFLGKSLDYGYPFFRKGFATLNCTQSVPLKDLITVVFDDLNTAPRNPPSHERVLRGLAKEHTGVNAVYISRNRSVDKIKKLNSNVDVFVVDGDKQGRIWSEALARVETKYVLIASNMDTFDDDINLKRLLRVLSHNPEVVIASGAYKTRNGHWDIGCQQALIRNYTLTLQGGYYLSHKDCLFCDFSPGPWVARTKELVFDERLDFGVFRDVFLRARKQNKIAVSCPDVMFNIGEIQEDDDGKYAAFARKHDLKKIVETNGRVRWYGCRHGIKYGSRMCSKTRGLAVPPCDLENLADAIKLIMSECEKAGMFCELQEGTLLGAVKFNKVLPWERDADLTFLTANYTAFKKLGPVFKAAGYGLSSDDKSVWCCVDDRQAGGKFKMSADGWNIELYGQHLMESEMLAARGESATKVDFAGQMVTVMRNPGLFARNRYGESIYKHQEHWLDRGKASGWHFYNPAKFEKCPTSGHSGCLSQYAIDGNMQFDRNICPCSLDTEELEP